MRIVYCLWQYAWIIQWSWWRHQMESFSALLAICTGNSPVTGEFPAQRPVTRAWINGWVNNGEAGDLRRHCAYYDVIVMPCRKSVPGNCVFVQPRVHFTNDFPSQFKFDGNFILFSSKLWYCDRYEILLSWHVQNFYAYNTIVQWSYTNSNFPSDLNNDGKIFREMGPRLCVNTLTFDNKLRSMQNTGLSWSVLYNPAETLIAYSRASIH